MTEERSHPDSKTVADPLVSRAYRQAATERVPEALDAAVLRKARQQAAGRDYSPYAKWIYWLRPTAWAATITLSLAIVLQVVDAPRDAIDETSFAPALNVEPKAETEVFFEAPEADRPARRLEQQAPEPGDSIEADLQPAPAANLAPTAARIAPSTSAGGAASNGDRAMSAPAAVPAEARVDVRTQEELQVFHVDDAPLVQEAEDLARMREGPAREQSADGLAASSFAISASSGATVCSDEDTAEPATWLECIERLEDAGEEALAAEQRDLLQLAFPDFVLPE